MKCRSLSELTQWTIVTSLLCFPSGPQAPRLRALQGEEPPDPAQLWSLQERDKHATHTFISICKYTNESTEKSDNNSRAKIPQINKIKTQKLHI